MRKIIAVLLTATLFGCSSGPRFNKISLWVGVKAPPIIELGIDLKLEDSTKHQERLKLMEFYSKIWKSKENTDG